MSDGNPIVNLGDLAKPATALVEKVSDAIGGICKPWQIRRVADAEAYAAITQAKAKIKIDSLEHRAIQRFFTEEAKKQNNIESITAKAIPILDENAHPENMEDDWVINFFDKCRLISDEEMQVLWARVLAGEANTPSTYSKRTVNFLGSLDKSDATLFQSLCGFGFYDGTVIPLIYEPNGGIYKEHGISFSELLHLDEIGLISFNNVSGYKRVHLPSEYSMYYYGTHVVIDYKDATDNSLEIGQVLLSKIGKELAPICSSKPIPGFLEYILEEWITKRSLCVYSPLPKT